MQERRWEMRENDVVRARATGDISECCIQSWGPMPKEYYEEALLYSLSLSLSLSAWIQQAFVYNVGKSTPNIVQTPPVDLA